MIKFQLQKENERIADLAEQIHTDSPDKGYRRIRDELEKILLSPRPETLSAAISLGLLSKYLTGAGGKMPRLAQLGGLPAKALTRWISFAAMLRSSGYIASAEEFLLSLRLDGRTVRCASNAEEMLKNEPPSDQLGWKRLLNRYGVDSVSCAASAHDLLFGSDCGKELRAVLKSGECFSLKHLAVTGDDLLELGLKGTELGEMLRFLLDYVMEHPDKNRREILLGLAYTEEN